ncbi:MAG: radical SAM protein [Bacteroidales bacterium]|nr:radical SAM protein [Bacteroidales bacterium]
MNKFKLNSYLYFLEYNEDVVCLNLLNKQIIILEGKKYNQLKQTKNNIDSLKEINPNLFSLLLKLEFIIKAEINEMDWINSDYNVEIFRNTSYRLTVLPTLNCNYRCWYCYETKDPKLMSKDVFQRIIKHINYKIDVDKVTKIDLDWFGGEPLIGFEKVVYPLSLKAKDICKKNKIGFTNQITTNGLLVNESMIDKFNCIKLNNFQITLDGNKYYHEKVKKGINTYQRTVNNINLLCSHIDNINLVLRINFTDQNLESSVDIIEDINKENRKKIEVSFQRVWQIKDNNQYYYNVDKIKAIFKAEGFKLSEYNIQLVQACYVDRLEQAIINYNGDVFKCTARDFLQENREGILDSEGFIDWDFSKQYKRFGKKRYENEMCLNCDLLPACYGPCSQKVLEINPDNFDKICNYNGLKLSIDEMLKRYYHEEII